MSEVMKKRFPMPFHTEFALKRLLKALKNDGFIDAQISVVDNEYSHISFWDNDRKQRFLMPYEGEWYEHHTLDDFGGDGE